jgi:acyl dehydratase
MARHQVPVVTASALPGQRVFGDVAAGDRLGPVDFALPLYRLVVAAGGNRDFNSIHHNRGYAVASGSPDAYASTFILMGTWERVVRDWIGDAGTIRSISGFRMRKFNLVGTVMSVSGTVTGVRTDGDSGVVTLELVSMVGQDVTVGPGQVEVTLPLAAPPVPRLTAAGGEDRDEP